MVDFYNGKPSGDSPVSFHLDVRPALDDYDSIKDRLLMAMKPWLRMLGSSGQVPAASTASK